MRPFVVGSLLVSILVAASASHADDWDLGRGGPYVGIGASRGFSFFDDAFRDELGTSTVHVDDAWGLNARAGYHFTSWFSTELEYEWQQRFKVETGTTPLAEITTHTIGANLRLVAPLGRVQPYFLIGIGGTFFDVSAPSFIKIDNAALCGRLGAGVDVYVTRNLLLNLGTEAVLSDADVSTFGSTQAPGYIALQFGLGYRF